MTTHPPGSDGSRRPGGVQHVSLIRGLLACGLLASLTWLATDLFASLSYEGTATPSTRSAAYQ